MRAKLVTAYALLAEIRNASVVETRDEGGADDDGVAEANVRTYQQRPPGEAY